MTWTLYQGSCLDPVTGLALLADKSVDVVITDPPYEAEAHSLQRRQKRANWRALQKLAGNVAGVEFAPLDFDPITEDERDAVAQHFGRIARQRVLVFCQVEAVHLWRASLEGAGLRYRRTIPWVKPDAMPSLHGRWPGQAWEAIVLATAKGCGPCPVGGKAVSYRYPRAQNKTHDTAKPVPLMLAMVEDFTLPGDLVLDPFAGAGTTGVACRKLGREFIGWEIDPATHALAERRLRGQRAIVQPHQPELFG